MAALLQDAETSIALKPTEDFTVFHPNVLIGTNNELRLAENRIYYEILNYNHSSEPSRLAYKVAYSSITNMIDASTVSRNAAKEVMRIAKALQSRVFFLNKEFMEKHFGEKFPISIVAFPTIRYLDGSFDIELNAYFKQLLIKTGIGFTKGDIDQLRDFKHEASFYTYWLIRSQQWKFNGNTLEYNIEDFKRAIGCEGKYEGRIDNFKTNILHPVQKEFKGTWVEFEYEFVKEGWGGQVTKIILTFRSDYEMAKILKLGFKHSWEETLSNYGITERDIIRIRHKVNNEEEIKPGLIWDSFYVNTTLKICIEEFSKRSKNPKLKRINHFGAFIHAAMFNHYFIDQVQERKPSTLDKNQTSIFETKTHVYTPPLNNKYPDLVMKYEDFLDLYVEFKEKMKVNITEKDFATRNGYIIKGEFVTKPRL